jgi:DNA-binding MarR family transcriptional regulator
MGIRVSDKGVKEKLTLTQLILIYLSSRGCLTLEELEEYTNAKREVLLVTLTRMYKKGLIYRKWRHFSGRKYREYCLKYREEILH